MVKLEEQAENNAAAETHPEGTCYMCHKQSENIVMYAVSYPLHYSQRPICVDCSDKVSIAVMRALDSVGW